LDEVIANANSNVTKALYEMATSENDIAATLFWLKCRAGWRESPALELSSIAPRPFIVAKKPGGNK